MTIESDLGTIGALSPVDYIRVVTQDGKSRDIKVADAQAIFGNDDISTEPFIPYKSGTNLVNSPLKYDATVGELVSTVALRAPAGTIYIGKQLGLDDAGGSLVYTNLKDDLTRVCVVVGFDDTGTVRRPFTTEFAPKQFRVILQPDNSRQTTNASFTEILTATENEFVSSLYAQIGTTVPTADVNFKFYLGSVDADNLVIDETKPASFFTADTEFKLDLNPILGLFQGQPGILLVTSANAFSLKRDAANTDFWFAVDRQIGTFSELVSEAGLALLKMEDLADVDATQKAVGDLLIYTNNGKWEPTNTLGEYLKDVVKSGNNLVFTQGDGTVIGIPLPSPTGAPTIASFALTDVNPHEPVGYNLNKIVNYSFDITNHQELTGNLTLDVSIGDNKLIPTPVVDGVVTGTVELSGIDTASEKTIHFKITGTGSAGSFESNTYSVEIKQPTALKYVYYGASQAEASAVDPSTLTRKLLHEPQQEFSFSIQVTTSDYYYIFVPHDPGLDKLYNTTLGNIDVTANFSTPPAGQKLLNVQTIDGISYDSYRRGPAPSAGEQDLKVVML